MKTILLATDGSPSAEEATSLAVELARSTGWELRIVTAWSMAAPTYGYAPATFVSEALEEERDEASAVLQRAVEAAFAAGVEPTAELRRGRAVDEICAAAAESRASLIVLGAHGWGAVKRFLFGSVSNGVLHRAPCPVLVVRGDARLAAAEPAGAAAAAGG